MEYMFKKLFSLSLLVSTSAVLADCCDTICERLCDAPARPVICFTPRSQSFNNVIKNAGMDLNNQYLYNVDGFNGSFKFTFEYDHSFNGKILGECLFGKAAVCTNGCNEDAVALHIVGSAAAPNGTTDLVADNFLLPRDFSSTVFIKPSIENFNVHLQAYFGFDEWLSGLYLRVYAPITVSRWKLETSEKVEVAGVTGYEEGEISSVEVPTDELYSTFLEYTRGNTSLTLPGDITVERLRFTRFGQCDYDSTTQLADLRVELGWNFAQSDNCHFGLYVHGAIPTAGDCEDDCDTLLWGAKAGNGKHWELGGGLSAHRMLWRSENNAQQFGFFLDATITHMFAHTQNITLDLKNKPLSRYIIAQKLVTPATTGLTVGGDAATYQFGAAFAPVANFTTRPVSISYPVQADVMAKFVYTHRGFSWAIGYDFWGQTCPSIEVGCDDDCKTSAFSEDTWALRGNANLYGYTGAIINNRTPIALPATMNSTDAFNIGSVITNPDNAIVDNFAPATLTTAVPTTVFNSQTSAVQTNASNPPVFISTDDLDVAGSTPRGLSNSLFTELNYTWIDYACWVPYFGIGARVEFGLNHSNQTVAIPSVTPPTTTNENCNRCDNCDTCSVTKWGIWIQGGLSFN